MSTWSRRWLTRRAATPGTPSRAAGPANAPEVGEETTPIVFEPFATPVAPRAGWVGVADAITPRGEVLVLWATPSGSQDVTHRERAENGVTWGAERPPVPVPGCITRQDGSGSYEVSDVADIGLAHVLLAGLPDGGFLTAGSRCSWSPETGAEQNATVYDADGRVACRGVLGDGLNEVRVSAGGHVYVTYDEEGIHGNLGWGSYFGGPEPIGSLGVRRFTRQLEPALVDVFTPGSDVPSRDSVGGVSLEGETLWMSYYSEYPIVRVVEDRARSWTHEHSTVSTVLGRGDTVAIAGHCGRRHEVLVMDLHADGTGVDRPGRWHMVDEAGQPLVAELAHETYLYARDKTRWLRADIAALL